MPEYQAVRSTTPCSKSASNPSSPPKSPSPPPRSSTSTPPSSSPTCCCPSNAWGSPFEFLAGEGPVVHHPVRTLADIQRLRTDRASELGYVAEAIERVVAHFKDRLGIIGFCGAPFTLASYMIEGGGSRNYIHTKTLMYRQPAAWRMLLDKLVVVLREYAAQQVDAGADVIQIFDSWAGALSVEDYRDFVLPATSTLVREVQALGVPVIYFGVDTASLLPAMRETGADVLGLDWRTPLDEAWRTLDYACAVQGNLDPITLFAQPELIRKRVHQILAQAAGRPGHIFNLGHGIVPETPVENVQLVVKFVREFSLPGMLSPDLSIAAAVTIIRQVRSWLNHRYRGPAARARHPRYARRYPRLPEQRRQRPPHARPRHRRDPPPLLADRQEPALPR